MKYKDYLNAARKHKITCEVIYHELDDTTKPLETLRKKSLLLNLYYLSGYIVECSIKYGIYDLNGFDRKQNVDELDKKDLNYKDHIRFHRFEKYSEHLNRHISGRIPLLNCKKNIDTEIIQLYREWDAEVRYSYDLKGKNESHYIGFYRYSIEIFKAIINNTRG